MKKIDPAIGFIVGIIIAGFTTSLILLLTLYFTKDKKISLAITIIILAITLIIIKIIQIIKLIRKSKQVKK